MKKFSITSTFLLFVISGMMTFFLNSCTKDDQLEEPEQSTMNLGYKYSKKIDVSDSEGNSAVVEISSNNFQDVNSITVDDLEFRVTTQNFSRRSNAKTKSFDEKQSVDKNFDNVIFVDIFETDLNDDITGYWVQVKEQPDIGTRAVKVFAYGSTGVRGIYAILLDESKSKCHLDMDLDILVDGNSTFYSELADFRLRDVNENDIFCSNNEYYKYRAKFSKGGCTFGSVEFDFLWVIGCI